MDVLYNVEENICYYFHFYRDFKYWTLVCNLSRSICAVGMNDTLDHVRLRCASTFQSIITSIPTGYSSWSVKRWEKIDLQLATIHNPVTLWHHSILVFFHQNFLWKCYSWMFSALYSSVFTWSLPHRQFLEKQHGCGFGSAVTRHTDGIICASLSRSLFVCVHIKTTPWSFQLQSGEDDVSHFVLY